MIEAPINPVQESGIPGTSKAFKAWWAQHCAAETVSAELHIAAGRAYLTLLSIEMNREPFQSLAATGVCSDDLGTFARLWAAHTGAL
jgi:hypothetical protein